MSKAKTLMQLMVWAGRERVGELLPVPFHGWANRHDTGCQAFIAAQDDDGPRIEVWRDSEWYLDIYEFNERGKTKGIQPECEWAAPIVTQLHDTLLAEYEAAMAERDAQNRLRVAADDTAKAKAISRYAEAASKAVG